MTESHLNPLRIFCRNCGAPAVFNIQKQSYACPHCGEVTGIQEAKKNVYSWRALQKENTENRLRQETVFVSDCPGCGARVIIPEGEASGTCDFCSGKLARRELEDPSQLPEVIIPFFITAKEARERFDRWLESIAKTPEGELLGKCLDHMTGYYLPYQVARGPVAAEIRRDGTERRYRCRGYLDGTAVNTSSQLDNLTLNDAEPFDWSAARPFEFGYIAGQRVKLSDISDADTNKRIIEEVTEDFRPEAEKIMQSKGLEIILATGDMDVLSALLPMYVVKTGELTAVMNGQTGRIAVFGGRIRTTYPWMAEPAVYTLLATAALAYLAGEVTAELLFYGGGFFGVLFFAIMGSGKSAKKTRIIHKSRPCAATRSDRGALIVTEGGPAPETPDRAPVFYEPDEEGKEVPAKVSFFTFHRWLMFVFGSLATCFLPVLLAIPIRLLCMEEGEEFLDRFDIAGGCVWYLITFFVALIYYLKGFRVVIYEYPVACEIQADGNLRPIRRQDDRMLTLPAMFDGGKKGRRITMKDLKTHPMNALMALGFMLLTLFMSVYLIIKP